MLTELCQELHNWFERKTYTGTITLSGGAVSFADGTDPGLINGQFFRVIGSVFSDGVHMYPDPEMPDETFDGAIWAMAIPAPVLKLAGEIEAWRAKYETADSAALSPFASESFGGYSYTKAGSGSSGASAPSWKSTFKSRMSAWRKI